MRIRDGYYRRFEIPRKRDLKPTACAAEFSSLLTCWKDMNIDSGACQEFVNALKDCMSKKPFGNLHRKSSMPVNSNLRIQATGYKRL